MQAKYHNGDLPCKMIEEDKVIGEDKKVSGGKRLQWGPPADWESYDKETKTKKSWLPEDEVKFLKNLDINTWLPIFVEGIREKQDPLSWVAV